MNELIGHHLLKLGQMCEMGVGVGWSDVIFTVHYFLKNCPLFFYFRKGMGWGGGGGRGH